MTEPFHPQPARARAPAKSVGATRRASLRRIGALIGLFSAAVGPAGLLVACGGGGSSDAAPAGAQLDAGSPEAAPSPPPEASPAPPSPAPPEAPPETPPESPPEPAPAPAPSGPPTMTTLNATLKNPWGLAFLPDGRMLVTQKGGTMLLLNADGSTQGAISGVPDVVAVGQGGLLDVALDPDFATDPWVYWSYAEGGAGGTAGTAVARGRLSGTTLVDVAVIYRQSPKVPGSSHFGSRLAFRADKTLFVTLGERQQGSLAQDLGATLGKVVRIERDGKPAAGNPSIAAAARPEIWSYGHRNPQGAAVHPGSGDLWIVEHGPQRGDELNLVVAGGNYGWPNVSYGCNYGVAPVNDACRIGGGVHTPNYIEPVSHWPPLTVAPAGLMFYAGAGFPEWHGNAFIGALKGTALWRIELNGNVEAAREQLFADLGERVRCVAQGPDGWIYLLTDSGKLIRIAR